MGTVGDVAGQRTGDSYAGTELATADRFVRCCVISRLNESQVVTKDLRFFGAMRHLSLPEGPLKLVCPDDIGRLLRAAFYSASPNGAVLKATGCLEGSSERCAEAEAAAQVFMPGSESTFHAFPDGRLPAQWNEVKDILHTFAAVCYRTLMWFWHPEWTMPIKIIDSWVPRRPPSGVMPLSVTTRFQSGTATSGDPTVMCLSLWSSDAARFRC